MIDIVDSVFSAIKKIANPAATLAINQAQRNEAFIKVLKSLKLDPTQPLKNVDVVYIYALVEYGTSKSESVRKLFKEKEIKNAFWQAYTSGNSLGFLQGVENFLAWNPLGDEIRAEKIVISLELEEFGKAFIEIAKLTTSPEFQPYPDWNMDKYPEEFKALIKEKIRSFCGRKFVFDTFAQFLQENSHGYFTVVGDAGMGKSTIAAKYVFDHKTPCYFNIKSEGRNRPEQFLESIRQQLIKHYNLQHVADVDLSTLLERVSKQLLPNQRLVIVVDALDEVEQEPGKNLLYLPMTLPEKVYFLLTRRPYTLENKRLSLSPGVPVKELDLRMDEYEQLNRDDIKDYINLFLNHDPDYQYDLRKLIQKRHITAGDFVEQLADKSENNFMYLRYLLPGIARGFYDDLSLKQLPDGLQDYYQQHWVRMGMDEKPQESKVIFLFILVEIGTSIPCEMIAEIAGVDEYDVQSVLDDWVEYLKTQDIDGDICYSIYHASFLDFLKNKKVLDSNRKLFKQVNQQIVDYWEN
ncbi:MAG: NACHT domain-containing protein [Nostocaceae cyanobacterium]|nr:NACHT domain-containing protein [Nostocaceae cyanobacterium]